MPLEGTNSKKESNPMKACIADDDFFALLLALLTVEQLGYEVAAFKDGESLLAHLKANPKIDLVITAYGMPGMNGLEVLKEIRNSSELKDIPVVVQTTTEALKGRIVEASGIYAAKVGKPGLEEVLTSLRRRVATVSDLNH
jgi:chemotaxis family two-component system sensor histidine kinase/response regulator PixL